MKRLTLLITVALMAGCGSSSQVTASSNGRPRWTRPIMGPDGRQAHVVACYDRLSVCYQRSSWVCPRGYDLIDRSGRGAGSSTVSHTYAYQNRFLGAGAVTRTRSRGRFRYDMVIQCKDLNENLNRKPYSDRDCRYSAWCRQLGRCRFSQGKCVR